MKNNLKINIGCSISPTIGWENFDNSPGMTLAKFKIVADIMYFFKIITKDQYEVVLFYKENKIKYANVSKKIPLSNESVYVVYSSHMLEHLDRNEASLCIKEAHRVLHKNGIIRLVLPNIKQYVDEYLVHNDADKFIESTFMGTTVPKSLIKKIMNFISGPRHHLWMYDEQSLSKLLINHGFNSPKILKAGETRIENYGNLDLFEREGDSFYIEAYKN